MLYAVEVVSLSSANIHTLESCINTAVYRIFGVSDRSNLEFIRCCVGLNPMKDLIDRKRCKFIDQLQCDASFSTLLLVYGFNYVSSVGPICVLVVFMCVVVILCFSLLLHLMRNKVYITSEIEEI